MLCAFDLLKKGQFLLEEMHSLKKGQKQKYFSVEVNKIHKGHQNKRGLLRDASAWRRCRLTAEVTQEGWSELKVVIKDLLLQLSYSSFSLVILFSTFI